MKIRDKLASGSNRKPDKVATTSDRLQKILSEKQMKQSDLARATGISRGAISNYVLGRYAPKSDIVQKLANALNCSEMWLWGYDVPMEKSSRAFGEEENPYALEINDILETLEVDDQRYIKDWVNEFAKNPEKMKISPTKMQLSEGDLMMLTLFRQIPADQQQVFIEMGRVYANSLKKD